MLTLCNIIFSLYSILILKIWLCRVITHVYANVGNLSSFHITCGRFIYKQHIYQIFSIDFKDLPCLSLLHCSISLLPLDLPLHSYQALSPFSYFRLLPLFYWNQKKIKWKQQSSITIFYFLNPVETNIFKNKYKDAFYHITCSLKQSTVFSFWYLH